jgi:hypothetical protein
MATRTKKRSTVDRKVAQVDKIIEEQVEAIDEELEKVQRMMRPWEKLKDREGRLRAARRALLGGSRSTGEGGSNLRQEDIVGYLRENPGSVPAQIAQHFGVTQPTVSSHLYRGKNERFLSKDGHWYLRDPKSGINTVEDLDGEEEDDE